MIEDGLNEDPIGKKVYMNIDDQLSDSSCCTQEDIQETKKENAMEFLSFKTDNL